MIEHMDEKYRENIRNYLVNRALTVRVDADLNYLNLAGMSEDFYAEFLNLLLDLRLENANASERNKAGIDLIDIENRVAAQVSVTCAPKTIREKIRNSIKKFNIPDGERWQFYFVPITNQAPDLHKDFELPEDLFFDKNKDVLDISRIMELAEGIDKLHALSELVDKYGKYEHKMSNDKHCFSAEDKNISDRIFIESPKLIPSLYESESVLLSECKVLFLGDAGSGKTYTIMRLIKGDKQGQQSKLFSTNETQGVEISEFHVKRGDNIITMHIWDFGGQEILHSLHRCFMTDQTAYVVTVSSRETQTDQRARYWLRNINAFAPNSPIMLYVNCWKGDDGRRVIDEVRLRRDYPNIVEVTYCSAADADEIAFRNSFTNKLIDLVSISGALDRKISRSYYNTLTAIREEKGSYLTGARYREICTENGVDNENAPDLLTFFNYLGVCFSYHQDTKRKELTDYRLLNPNWLVNAVCAVMVNGRDIAQNGKLTIAAIRLILSNHAQTVVYSNDEISYILDVASAHEIWYRMDKVSVFIPALCAQDTPIEALDAEDYSVHAQYRYIYDYLPDNVVHHLMIRFTEKNIHISSCWRKGMVVRDHDYCKATIYMADDENLVVDLWSKPSNPTNELFILIRNEVISVNRKMGLHASEAIAKDNDIFTIKSLLYAHNRSAQEVYGRITGKEYSVGELLEYFYDPATISRMKVDDKGDIIITPYLFHKQKKNDPMFRHALYNAYNQKCSYCSEPLRFVDMQVDSILANKHLDPNDISTKAYIAELRQKGFDINKPDYIENYLPACYSCNRRKGNRPFGVNTLRFYHDLAIRHTPRVLELMRKYRGELSPVNIDSGHETIVIPDEENRSGLAEKEKDITEESLVDDSSEATINGLNDLSAELSTENDTSEAINEEKENEDDQQQSEDGPSDNPPWDTSIGDVFPSADLEKNLSKWCCYYFDIKYYDSIHSKVEEGVPITANDGNQIMFICILRINTSEHWEELNKRIDEAIAISPEFHGILYIIFHYGDENYSADYYDTVKKYCDKNITITLINDSLLYCEALEDNRLYSYFTAVEKKSLNELDPDLIEEYYSTAFDSLFSMEKYRHVELFDLLEIINGMKMMGFNKHIAEEASFLFSVSEDGAKLSPANAYEYQDIIYKLFLIDRGYINVADNEEFDEGQSSDARQAEETDGNDTTPTMIPAKKTATGKPSPADLEEATKLVLEEFDKWLGEYKQTDDIQYKVVKHPYRQKSGTQNGYDCGISVAANEERYRLRFECKCYTRNKRNSDEEKVKELKLVAYSYSLLNYYSDCNDDCNYRWILVSPFGELENGIHDNLFEGWNANHHKVKIFEVTEEVSEIKCCEFLSVSEEAYRKIYGTAPKSTIENREKVFSWLLNTVIGEDEVKQKAESKLEEFKPVFGDFAEQDAQDLLVTNTQSGSSALNELLVSLRCKKGSKQYYGTYIVGEYGTGKSWLLFQAIHEIIDHPRINPFEPHYLKMQEIDLTDDYDGIISSQVKCFLEKHNINRRNLQYKSSGKTPVVFLDGFDEVLSGLSYTDKKVDTLFEIIKQIREINGNTLFVVSSRESDYAACDNNLVFANEKHKFSKIVLGNFTADQVRKGLEKMEKKEGADTEHLKKLAADGKFIQLMQHPVYYGFLPTIVARTKSARAKKESFDETVILHQIIRNCIKEIKESGGSISKKGLCQNAITKTMDARSQIRISYSKKTASVKDPLTKIRDIPAGIFKVVDSDESCCHVEFKHNVIREFLVAERLYDFVRKCAEEEPIDLDSKMAFTGYLEKLPLTMVIQKFFLELIKDDEQYSSKIHELLVCWIQEPDIKANKILSTRLLEILLMPDSTLSGSKEDYLKLGGINVHGLYLWNCTLRYADLRNAKIENLQMTNVELADLNLRGAEFTNLQILSDDPIADFTHLYINGYHHIVASTKGGQLIDYEIEELNETEKVNIKLQKNAKSYENSVILGLKSDFCFIKENMLCDTNLSALYSIHSSDKLLRIVRSGDRLCCLIEREKESYAVCFEEGNTETFHLRYPDINNFCFIGREGYAYVTNGKLVFRNRADVKERDSDIDWMEGMCICSGGADITNDILFIAKPGKLIKMRLTLDGYSVEEEYELRGAYAVGHIMYISDGVLAASDETSLFILRLSGNVCTIHKLSGGVKCQNLDLGEGNNRVRDESAYRMFDSINKPAVRM